MKAYLSFLLMSSLLLSSCGSILAKRYAKNPFHHSYDLNYRNAIAEGATPEQAHRQALAVASEKHTQVVEMRELAEKRGTEKHYDAISKQLGVPTAKPDEGERPGLQWE